MLGTTLYTVHARMPGRQLRPPADLGCAYTLLCRRLGVERISSTNNAAHLLTIDQC